MIEMFRSLAGDLTGTNPDLVLVLAATFFLFVAVSFIRFLELTIDFVFRRKR